MGVQQICPLCMGWMLHYRQRQFKCNCGYTTKGNAMDLTLKRTDFTLDGIFGVLLDETGQQIAMTLEHSYDGQPKIPPGQYLCYRSMHRLEGMDHDFETFEIRGVEGHSNLLFHWGNFNKDSSGCILLGESRTGEMITHSRDTFQKFMLLENDSVKFKIAIA